MLVLAQAWPEGLRAQQLIGAAMAALRERGLLEAAEINEAEIERTMNDLIALSTRRFAEVLPWTPRVRREVPPKPAVRAVTRVEAELSGVVTTPRHDPVVLEEPTRTLASLLDGTRDLRALVNEVSRRIDSGELTPSAELSGPDRASRLAELVMGSVA